MLTESILGTVSAIHPGKGPASYCLDRIYSRDPDRIFIMEPVFRYDQRAGNKTGLQLSSITRLPAFPFACISLGIVGACIKVLLGNIQEEVHGLVLWLFSIAVAVILLSITGIAFYL